MLPCYSSITPLSIHIRHDIQLSKIINITQQLPLRVPFIHSLKKIHMYSYVCRLFQGLEILRWTRQRWFLCSWTIKSGMEKRQYKIITQKILLLVIHALKEKLQVPWKHIIEELLCLRELRIPSKEITFKKVLIIQTVTWRGRQARRVGGRNTRRGSRGIKYQEVDLSYLIEYAKWELDCSQTK